MHFIFNLLRLPEKRLSPGEMLLHGYAVLTHVHAPSLDCLHALKTADVSVPEGSIVACNRMLVGRPDIRAQRCIYRAIKRGHIATIVKNALGSEKKITVPEGIADPSVFDLSEKIETYYADEGRDNDLEKTENSKQRQEIFDAQLEYVFSFGKNLYLAFYNAYFLTNDLTQNITLLDSPAMLLPNIEKATDYLVQMSGVCVATVSTSTKLYPLSSAVGDEPFLMSSFADEKVAGPAIEFFKTILILKNIRVFFCKDPLQISLISKYLDSESLIFLLDEMYAPTDLNFIDHPERRFIIRPSAQLHALYLTSLKSK